jgi:UDP-GlcNAc:undecaprenyl-phosphate/decaprenyl-phosphate GlcNAc-1-phosphate transferase
MNILLFSIINLLNLLIIYLINKYRISISKKLKLIDFPDSSRKIHFKETPLIGGLIIVIIYFTNTVFFFYTFDISSNSLFILVLTLWGFLIGYLDDRISVNPYLRLFLIGGALLIILSLNDNLVIRNLYFELTNFNLVLNYLSIPFTILSILLLVNAINLSDGINSLAMIIIIYFSLYLYFNTLDQNKYLIINLIISLTILSYLNFKGNFFLGNSGSYQLGMLISLSIISSYNSKLDQGIMTNSEELFIILILPGLDMFRIFIERLINKQNPFSGDKQHLHHYLIKKYSLKISLFAYLIMLSTPYICYQVTNYKPILIITASIISYFIIIFHLRKFNLK